MLHTATSHRVRSAALLAGLALAGLSACGSNSEDGSATDGAADGAGSTEAPSAAEAETSNAPTGKVAKADRIAAAAAALAEHSAVIRTQGVAGPLAFRSNEILDGGEKRLYFPSGEFGICLRDVHFFAQWNRVDQRSKLPRAQDQEKFPDQFAAFLEVNEALAERGIEFLIAPIPRPIQIYPERLVDGLEVPGDFVGADPGIAAFLAKLSEAGVEVLHLTPHFAAQRFTEDPEQDLYLFHDWNNHWTPRAVNLTADLVAERVAQMEGFEPGPLREGRDYFVDHMQVTYAVPQPGSKPRQTPIWVDSVVDDAGERAHQRSQTAEILLLGDSNSGWYNKQAAPLGDQLMRRLGHHLDVIAITGANAQANWDSIARRPPEGRLGAKQIVIWVFEAATLVDPALAAPQLVLD